MSYIFIFCFLLTQLIYFPPMYHVRFHGDRSYVHRFPQNIYFFALLGQTSHLLHTKDIQ